MEVEYRVIRFQWETPEKESKGLNNLAEEGWRVKHVSETSEGYYRTYLLERRQESRYEVEMKKA